jgi:hypothetical protein
MRGGFVSDLLGLIGESNGHAFLQSTWLTLAVTSREIIACWGQKQSR